MRRAKARTLWKLHKILKKRKAALQAEEGEYYEIEKVRFNVRILILNKELEL
jgi:hypothetical protein